MLASFILISLLGCGSNIQHIPTTTTIVEPSRVYSASFDKVWAATLQALSDEGNLKVIDKSGGIIVTEPKTVDSKELSIVGTTFLGKTYKSNYTVNVKVMASNKTDVKLMLNCKLFR